MGIVSRGTGEVGLPLSGGAEGASRVAMAGCVVQVHSDSAGKEQIDERKVGRSNDPEVTIS